MDRRRSSRYPGKQPDSKLVFIGVQARTDSHRLPGKINLSIFGKTILERVMGSCQEAADYLNRNFTRYNTIVRLAVLPPANDPLIERYGRSLPTFVVDDADPNDVLSRYVTACRTMRADYIVRITADCVFTAPYLISRHIKAALFTEHDYTSNVIFRTFREGMDVEVVSARLMEWLDANCVTPTFREHVTNRLQHRDGIPRDFKFCHIMNDVDDSFMKTSIDDIGDYHRAIAEFESLHSKRRGATSGGDTVS